MRSLSFFILFISSVSVAQEWISYPYRDPDLPLEQRVEDLLSRLTLDEKTKQLLYNAPAVDRIGLPAYNWWNEALHGVARAGKATVFPQAIGLAATWDTELMKRVGDVIAIEARAKHHDAVRKGRRGIYEGLTFWSPNINIFRDPRWGRGMETYGEDPYLTGRLAVSFIRGLQGDHPYYFKTIATPKHYAVHSGPEPERHAFDARVSERDLRETYLPAFRASIVEAGAHSIMCAYNKFRGMPCCGNDELLVSILRSEWGFKGYVVSDCWAIMDFYTFQNTARNAPEAAAIALKAGTDLNCGVSYDSLGVSVRMGLVTEELVDVSLRRLLRARFRLGMFDPPAMVPLANTPYSMNDAPEHRALALEAAQKSIVLLKNDGNILPLKKDLRKIAVIGPNADDVVVLLGNYNGWPSEPVTVLSGIRNAVEGKAVVVYEKGSVIAENTPTLVTVPGEVLSTRGQGVAVTGLRGEYFDNPRFEGEPVVTRVDRRVDFNWWENAPAPGVPADSFGIRWTGELSPPSSGMYDLGIRVFGAFKLYLEDTLLTEYSDRHVVYAKTASVLLEKGRSYRLRIDYHERRADAYAELIWQEPSDRLQERALNAASDADAIVLVLGLSPRLEGEEMPVQVPGFAGGDRTDIRLPKDQRELIEAVGRLKKPTVLVLLNGSAVSVPEADKVDAIVEAWYPGQAAGTAVADVLFGDVNPSGRLPVTFYRSIDQLPPFNDYAMKGRTYRYFEGEPWYPFGYGLSYTSFHYSDLVLPASVSAGDSVTVRVQVKNKGERDGEEVVQVYVTDVNASVSVPKRSLAAFTRIYLRKGESKTVELKIAPRAFSLIDDAGKRVIEEGMFDVSVGGEQPGMNGRLHAASTMSLTRRVRVLGTVGLDP